MTSRANNAAPRNNNRSAAPASYNHAGVRRNLFNGHHLRRPGPSSTASTSATTLQAPSTTDQDNATASSNTNSADIVVRDKNGNYEVEVPLVPIEKQEDVLEREREEARLAEAVKHYTRDRNRTPSEPAELLAAVQASLRMKVAGLQEDNWMFESEEDHY